MTHDALVVGAGLSGLVCAGRLAAAGARVVVLEASDRVGGRLLSGRVGDAFVDLGGMWMSMGQPRLAALATTLGAETIAHEHHGRMLLGGGPRGLVGRGLAAVAQLRGMRRIERLVRGVPAEAPARAARAGALDAASLASYLQRAVRNPTARERLALHAELMLAVDPARLSLLAYLATLGVTGGFAPEGAALPGGAREHRFAGGAQALALRLAEGLDVRLSEPVTALEDGPGAIVARGPRGAHGARRAVLAVPPALARTMALPLAPAARRFADAAIAGRVVKCFAAYARPFWRDAGLSGEVYLPRGTVRATVALDGDVAVLLAYVVGAEAERFGGRDPAERRGDVLATLAAHFGAPAAEPLDYLEHDWGAAPWSGGCVTTLPPGALTSGARWRDPHGRLHLAGTEAAVAWPGYMEGAIEAGERAAAEVLAAA